MSSMSSTVMLLSESLSHSCISGRVASGWLMAMMFYVSRPQEIQYRRVHEDAAAERVLASVVLIITLPF